MGNDVVVRYVTSRDGTRIGYLEQGVGPGLVLVQGAMADAHAFSELAAALAPGFTVYSPDRRGRGLSPRPYDPGHDVARDVEDVDAVLARTGARYLFGLSSGGVITLEAARVLQRVRKAAVFEPPVPQDGVSGEGIRRIHAAIEREDLGSALVESLLTSGTAPRFVRLLPPTAARLLARVVLELDARAGGRGERLRDLLPGIRYDFAVVAALDDRVADLAAVTVPVLLLGGTRSPAFLGRSTRALRSLLPETTYAEVGRVGHSGPQNRRRGGRPDVVAAELSRFFGQHGTDPGDRAGPPTGGPRSV